MTDIVWVASSCAMILAVILIRAVFGKRMSAGLRYALWALVLLRLLIPGTVLSSPVSVESAVTASETISDMEAVRGVRSVSRSESGVVSGVPRASRPRVSAPQTGTQTGLPGGQQGTAPQSADTSPGERVIIGSATPERFERIKKAVKLTDILSTIWYCGMAVTAAWFIFVNLRTYLSLRKRRVRLETELNCPVYAVEGISSSCLFLNSVYISKETAEDETERRFVLAHESAHRRHGDGFTVLLRSLALILHWYNPLAWTAAILSRRDAELFADAGAIAVLGEEERQNYGLTLIGLSSRFKPRADICVAATAMTGGKKELKERIKHMAKKTKTRVIIAAAVTALALAALLVCFLGCGDRRQSFSERELLPDWEAEGQDARGYTVYRGTRSGELQTYLNEMKKKGFSLLEEYITLEGSKILYRDGVWIEIRDKTHDSKTAANRSCCIKVEIQGKTRGLSRAEAARIIGTGGMEKEPVSLIEETPEGIWKKTGVQVFRCLFDYQRERDYSRYFINTYIVGPDGWYMPHLFLDIKAADVDSDGRDEAVVLEYGQAAGGWNIILISEFKTEHGAMICKARSRYDLDVGQVGLAVHGKRVFLTHAKPITVPGQDTISYEEAKEYALTFDDEGNVIIEDPEGELDLYGMPLPEDMPTEVPATPTPAPTESPYLDRDWAIDAAFGNAVKLGAVYGMEFERGDTEWSVDDSGGTPFIALGFPNRNGNGKLVCFFEPEELSDGAVPIANYQYFRTTSETPEEDEELREKLTSETITVTPEDIRAHGCTAREGDEYVQAAYECWAEKLAERLLSAAPDDPGRCTAASVVACGRIPGDPRTWNILIAAVPADIEQFSRFTAHALTFIDESSPEECFMWVNFGREVSLTQNADGSFSAPLMWE